MFIQQAFRAKHDFWRYLVGSLLIIAAYTVGQIPLGLVMVFDGDFSLTKGSMDPQGINSNLFLFLMLFSFLIAFLGLWFVVKYLHEQSLKELTTTRKKIDKNRIFLGFGLFAIYTIIATGLGYYMHPENYQLNFKLVPFLILCVIAILMVPIQTSFEEYVFRGYLMQGFGMLAKNKWFPLLLTSLIFGGLHVFNPEVSRLGYLVMIYYIGTGLLFGVVTLMDEGMELSLGMHAANNLIGVLLVTADWTAFSADSLLRDISQPEKMAFSEIIFPVFVMYPIFLLILSKIYGWKNWRKKLLGTVEVPVETNYLTEN